MKKTGFTIVELLIVIVVIGILAAITIIAYNGIQDQARRAGIKSDLAGAANLIGIDNTNNGQYPANTGAANGGLGLKTSNGATLEYRMDTSVTPATYCINETINGVGYYITNGSSAPIQGTACPVTVSTPITGAQFPGTPFASLCRSIIFDSSNNFYCGASTAVYKGDRFGNVITLAGTDSRTPGYVDATGSAARFQYCNGIVLNPINGNVYVTDNGNYAIRQITPAGVVTTLAGGTSGYADGTGTSAKFSGMYGLAVDTSGNMYTVNGGGSTQSVRKITLAGVVTTLAGSGIGYADGNGATAQFYSPLGIAIDKNNLLYVTDGNNHRIRKVTLTGDVTTFAGNSNQTPTDGQGTAASFAYPYAITTDYNNNIYVSDSNLNVQIIRKISPSGYVTTTAGSTSSYGGADGAGLSAQFNAPWAIAVDNGGVIYVGDNNGIRKLN